LNFGLHFVGQGVSETPSLALIPLCLSDSVIVHGLVQQELLIKIIVHNRIHVITRQAKHAKRMVRYLLFSRGDNTFFHFFAGRVRIGIRVGFLRHDFYHFQCNSVPFGSSFLG